MNTLSAEAPRDSQGTGRGRHWERILALGLLVCAGVLGASAIHSYHSFYHDDAFISLRYSRNWVSGQGPVWNPGERVEGYTNFLFVVLTAAFGLLKVDLVVASRIIGIASMLAICLVLVLPMIRRAVHEDIGVLGSAVGASFVISNPALWAWSFGGLETTLYALLLLLAVGSADRLLTDRPSPARWLAAGFFFVLAALTRPEGILVFFCAVLFWIVRGRGRNHCRGVGLMSLAFFTVIGPYWAWRILYYKSLFPNTFYAKGGLDLGKLTAGLAYLRTFALDPPYIVPIFILLAGALSIFGGWDDKTRYSAVILVAIVGFPVLWGGDHMPAYRLLIPCVPVFSLFLSRALPLLIPALSQKIAAGVALMTLCLGTVVNINPPRPVAAAAAMDQAAYVGSIVGRYIRERWPQDAVIALNTAGSTPYYCPHQRFIDMLGLNDRHIAMKSVTGRTLPWQTVPGHLKGDGAYVLSRTPDYIILGPAEGTSAATPWFLSDLELTRDKAFATLYRMKAVLLDIRDVPGYRKYERLQSGTLRFIYYQRTPLPEAPH